MKQKSESLGVLLEKEREKLRKLMERRKKTDEQIKVAKENIARYEQMANAKQFQMLSNSLDAQGVSMEDVLAAVATGDFLTLQSKIEAAAQCGTEES